MSAIYMAGSNDATNIAINLRQSESGSDYPPLIFIFNRK